MDRHPCDMPRGIGCQKGDRLGHIATFARLATGERNITFGEPSRHVGGPDIAHFRIVTDLGIDRPGQAAFTRIPCRASSSANCCASATCAALLAE